ncbi:GxxExxY protein [uncultured Draconibacterium sp.]|uniref:GxxExxY protein n=1 Tax=uncultured Draconibacterium sp. TaxID=1573823 RepID=UPI0029C808FE|nr:GxxExxY protein [uncultured Draconibacterium sp.]
MASIVYPHLDFAQEQSRTESGVQIRDLIFYNNRSLDFLQEIYDSYDCKQIVMELKNVQEVKQEHILQLNRYLKEQFGKFGIIITRKPAPQKVIKNTIDLWSAHRKCIIILDDNDIKSMVQVFDSKQRFPIEIIKKKYIEFTRACPS